MGRITFPFWKGNIELRSFRPSICLAVDSSSPFSAPGIDRDQWKIARNGCSLGPGYSRGISMTRHGPLSVRAGVVTVTAGSSHLSPQVTGRGASVRGIVPLPALNHYTSGVNQTCAVEDTLENRRLLSGETSCFSSTNNCFPGASATHSMKFFDTSISRQSRSISVSLYVAPSVM